MADDPATNPEIEENDELLLTDEVEPGDEAAERSDDDETDTNVNDEAEEEEEVLVFGDATDEEPDDSGLVKHLRDELKRARKEAAEARKAAPAEEAIDPGPKPTLADCEYDEEEFDRRYDKWREDTAKAEQKKTQATAASDEEIQRFQAKLNRINEERTALNRPDSEEAFDTVRAALSVAQQTALIEAVDDGNTAKLIYALAKNPDKLTAIAGEGNIVRFIKEVTKLEGQLKMVKRRKAPEPEQVQRGSAKPSSASADKKLEKMEKEAEKTGDRTALIRYRKTLKK